jgi:hypothetical protein
MTRGALHKGYTLIGSRSPENKEELIIGAKYPPSSLNQTNPKAAAGDKVPQAPVRQVRPDYFMVSRQIKLDGDGSASLNLLNFKRCVVRGVLDESISLRPFLTF